MNKSKKQNNVVLKTKAPPYKTGEVYENFMGRWSALLANEFTKLLPIKPGSQVLDVGSGTGSLAYAIINNFEVGKVVGIDPSVILLEHANKNNKYHHLSFIEGVGQDLPFEHNEFDASIALLSLHNVPNPADAVKEMLRVTKSGGIIAACEWDFLQGMQMFRVIWDSLFIANPETAESDTKNIKLGAKGQLIECWKGLGIKNCQLYKIDIPLTFTDFDDFYQPMLSNASATGATIKSLTSSEYIIFKKNLLNRLYKDKIGGPFTLNARAWAVSGIV